PDLLTGFYGSYDVMPEVGVYLIAVNGWDLTVDGNRSKTLGGGVPHRFMPLPDGGWLYEGDISFIAGAERPGINDLRWLVDYSAKVRVLDDLQVALELVYGQEDGAGYNKQGMQDGVHAADWYGGMLTTTYRAPDEAPAWLNGWAGALRFEYVRDRDLAISLPQPVGVEPDQTTLFGTALTLRYELVHGIVAVAEYKTDFERADVEGFPVLRYYPDEPYNIFKWFITREVIVGLVGSF
ncbi:MAG: outer membrane beta-barrel protein, partial [Myxococcota bacterium]